MADPNATEDVPEEIVETTEGEGDGLTPQQETTVEPDNSKEAEVEQSAEVTQESIPVRPTASYIIERKNRQLEKLRSKLNEEVEQEVESPNESLNERLERLEQMTIGQAEEKELQSFFEQQPDARKYEKTIKAYMQHDAYKAVPPEVIYRNVAWDDVQAKKDSKRKAADLEAGQTRSVGSSVRDTRRSDRKTAEDIANMTDAEFREYDREQQRLARS